MPRFYLTTAIDYVNSRPHLGHGLREDRRRRHRALQAARRVRHALRDGQRRALAERLQAGAQEQGWIRSRTAIGWSRSSATSGRASTSRSTTSSGRPSRGTRPACRSSSQRIARRRRHLRGCLRGLVLRRLRGVQAGEGPRRRQVPAAPAPKPEWIKEKNHFFRLSKYQQPLLEHFAAHPEFLAAGRRGATRSCGCSRAASRTSRSAAPGSRGAFRAVDPVERRLRLVRRADQLRVGGRASGPTTRCSRSGGRPTCTSSARTSRASTP